MKTLALIVLLLALLLTGCVTNAVQPVRCFFCGGPELPPFATPLQWRDCDRWCVQRAPGAPEVCR
jgi:hypothetical protein